MPASTTGLPCAADLDDVFAGVRMRRRERTWRRLRRADASPIERRGVNVARRGGECRERPVIARAMRARGSASGRRRSAPRPGGVAIATMVSSVANKHCGADAERGRRPDQLDRHRQPGRAYFSLEMMTVFTNASPMLSEVTPRILGDGQVHDAALVRIERAHLLRRAASAPSRPGTRHLPQLGVLVAAEALAVDDDALVVAELLPERRAHEVLQRLQRSPRWHSSVRRPRLRGRCAMPRRCLVDSRVERQRPSPSTTLWTNAVICVVSRSSSWSTVSPCAARCRLRPAPAFFIRRSAGGRDRLHHRRADHPVREVLLADAEQVADQPVDHEPARRPEEHEAGT